MIKGVKAFFAEYTQDRELNFFYIISLFKALSGSLVGLFIPIYLFTIGYGLADIALYFLIFFTTVVILMPTAMNVLSRMGIRKTSALGTFLLIGYYPLLYAIGQGLPYYWASLVLGISVVFEAASGNIALTAFLGSKNEGKGLSALQVIGICCGIIGPLIGGLLIYNFSYQAAFTFSAILLLFSLIPLYFLKDFKPRQEKFIFKEVIKQDTLNKGLSNQINAMLGLIGGIFWPIFIYINVENVVPLGIISSLTSFIMIFIVIFVGRKADQNEEGTLKTGIYFNAPSWILRLLFLSPYGLFFTNLYASVSGTFIDIPFSKVVFENAKKAKSKKNYFLFREYHLAIGRLIILIAAIIIGNMFWLFVISFFMTFGYFLALKRRKQTTQKTKKKNT